MREAGQAPFAFARPQARLTGGIDNQAAALTEEAVGKLRHGRAKFFCEGGKTWVVFDGAPVLLDPNGGKTQTAALLMRLCGIGSLTTLGRAVLQRLAVFGAEQSERIEMRQFSALDDDALLLPMSNNGVLRISPEGLKPTTNGSDGLRWWVSHPCGEPADIASALAASPSVGLQLFEELLVATQACETEALRWLVAMHEGLLPYVRDRIPSRMIVVHIGPSQSGKTTGAQRFSTLHGLGPVKGDFSVAALQALDEGLLVLDNKEHAHLSPSLISYCLYLATGAQFGRSDALGNLRTRSSRPVGVITSIEGVFREELRKRCLEIPFVNTGPCLPRAPIEGAIRQNRGRLLAALSHVFVKYLQEPVPHTSPFTGSEFSEYLDTLAALLFAYAEVAGRPRGWASDIILGWRDAIEPGASDGDEFEFQIHSVLHRGRLQAFPGPIVHDGRNGTLFVTDASSLLSALMEVTGRDPALPRSPTGLSRRLHGRRFESLAVIDSRTRPDLHQLTRTATQRPLGLFIPLAIEDTQPPTLTSPGPILLSELQLSEHYYLTTDDRCYCFGTYSSGVNRATGFRGVDIFAENAFMRDLQISPSTRSPALIEKKEAAVRRAARTLAALPAELRTATFVPMPPSNPPGHVEFDDRLVRILRTAHPTITDIRELLIQTAALPSKAKGISPSERAKYMTVTNDSGLAAPSVIVVFDDVVTTGAHFAAAKACLAASYPNARVVGVFLLRSLPFADSHRHPGTRALVKGQMNA